MMMEQPVSRSRWVVVLLVVLPLWLCLSAGGAVWYLLHREKKAAALEQQRFSRAVSATALEDDVRKLTHLVGERNTTSQSAAKNLTRAAAMIEGSLGPSNIGYVVTRTPGPAEWPLIHVRILGKNTDEPAVWIVGAYDSRQSSPGAEANATGVAAIMAAAQALAAETPERNIHFAFLPHWNDPTSLGLETARKFAELAGRPSVVLCVEAMGAGPELWLSSRDDAAAPLSKTAGLGSVKTAAVIGAGADSGLSDQLFEIGLPAVRVATRPLVGAHEPDDALPAATTLAAASGCLVELVRRCADTR